MINRPLLRLQLKGFCFTPHLIPTLATMIFLPLLISLGFWQLHRAEQKRVLIADYQARAYATPLQLNAVKGNLENVKYYPIQITGHYDNQHQILLDNKIYHQQVGFQVLTPFIPDNDKQIILVNRGWIVRNANRQQLPTIAPVTSEQTIRGIVYLPAQKPFLLNHQLEKTWPLVIQAIELGQLQKVLQQSLYPVVILLAPDAPYGFVREWVPVTMSPYKNIGYAVQWFALALALFIIFVVVNTGRINHD